MLTFILSFCKEKNYGFAISALSNVLSKTHVLEGDSVEVRPYYPWMGLSITEIPTSIIPTRVKMESNNIFASNFLGSHSERLKEIQNELGKNGCSVKWPEHDSTTLELISKDLTKPERGWDINGKALIQKYLDDVKVRKIEIDSDIWIEWKAKISLYEKKEYSQISIEHENSNFITTCIASTKVADEFERTFHDILTNLKKSHSMTHENYPLKYHQIEILGLCQFWEDIKCNAKDVKIEVGTERVTFHGTSDEIMQAKRMILEKLNQTSNEIVPTTEAALRCLKIPETKAQIDDYFRKDKMIVSWTVDDRYCKVFAFNTEDLKKAVRIIKIQVAEQSVTLDDSSKRLLGSQKWNDFVKSISNEFSTLHISESANKNVVNVTCCANSSIQVFEKVNAFFEMNRVVNETVKMELGYYNLITSYMAQDLAQINILLIQAGGQFQDKSNVEGNQEFALSGTATAVKNAKSALFDLTAKIFPADHEIERMSEFFELRQGKDALAGLEKKHRVSIQVDCKSSSKATPQPSIDHAVRISVPIGKGQHIFLVKGDITKLRVDALVNAANEKLDHAGGIAKAISDAG